jgi:hypothetical protein
VRIKLPSFERGPFHGHPNRLEQTGDKTVLHAHRWDHIMVATRPVRVRWRRTADGQLEDRVFRPFDFPLVAAGVEHEVEAVEPDTEFVCLFSLWQPGPNGLPMRVGDPKESA